MSDYFSNYPDEKDYEVLEFKEIIPGCNCLRLNYLKKDRVKMLSLLCKKNLENKENDV